MGIGDTLKKARLEKGISHAEIEKITKIRTRYLTSMENEQWDQFPGRVYLRGFLRTYSRQLGLNDDEIVTAFDELQIKEAKTEPLPEKIEIPGKPRKKLGIILAVIAIVLLVALQFVYKNYFYHVIPENNPSVGQTENGESTTPEIEDVQNPEEVENETGVGEEVPEIIESITFKIVVNSKCWASISSGSRLLYEGTLNRGDERTFSDLKRVSFHLGNAGGAEVFLNDESLGVLGGIGDIVRKTYLLEDNEITER